MTRRDMTIYSRPDGHSDREKTTAEMSPTFKSSLLCTPAKTTSVKQVLPYP